LAPDEEVSEDAPEEVVLTDEAGENRRFLLHDAFDADGTTYYLVEAAEEPDQVLLLRETADGLESVGGAEFDRVLALLEADE
jgi:hypothetical protein